MHYGRPPARRLLDRSAERRVRYAGRACSCSTTATRVISTRMHGMSWNDERRTWQLEIRNRNGACLDGELIESDEVVGIEPGSHLCLRGCERNLFLLLSAA